MWSGPTSVILLKTVKTNNGPLKIFAETSLTSRPRCGDVEKEAPNINNYAPKMISPQPYWLNDKNRLRRTPQLKTRIEHTIAKKHRHNKSKHSFRFSRANGKNQKRQSPDQRLIGWAFQGCDQQMRAYGGICIGDMLVKWFCVQCPNFGGQAGVKKHGLLA